MTVIAKWNGELIRDNGIYENLPMARYHEQCTIGASVSSTPLRKLDRETPLHAFWDSSLNPDRPEPDDDAAEPRHFRLGRAGHLIALESDEYIDRVVTRPDEWDSWRKVDSKKWRASETKAGKIVLTPKERQNVELMAKAIRQHPLYADGLLNGRVEHSLIWQDEKTGLWLKSRPDVIPLDDMIVDLKCQQKSSPDGVARAIRDYGYDLQMALAGIGMEKLMGVKVETYSIMAVEAAPPFAIHVATLDSELIEVAKRRLRRAINTFARCIKENDWPSYDEYDGKAVTLMGAYGKFQMEALDNEMRIGSLKEEF